jgi:hypothetical protein
MEIELARIEMGEVGEPDVRTERVVLPIQCTGRFPNLSSACAYTARA